MKLSKTTRREPTQTKTLQNEYVRQLVNLFSNFKHQSLEALKENTTVRQLEIETAVNIIQLEEMLRQYGVQLITNGSQITTIQAKTNFTAGTMFGQIALKQIGVEVVIGEGPADWRVIDALRVRDLSALRGVTNEMNKQIIKELTDGIQQGESMKKLANRLSERVEKIGKHRAMLLARTETINAFTQGAELRYTQAGIETLEWLSALEDGRRCDICGALNGVRFSIKSNHERPPLHPLCRCTIIPVID